MQTTIFRLALAVFLCLGGISAFAVQFKIATLSPNGSFWMNALKEAATEVSTLTEQRVTFKFYGGGVMGDDGVVLRKIRVGQLQGAIVQTGPLAASVQNVGLYNLPMQFRTFDEVERVRTVLDEEIVEGLRAKGYETLGIPGLGFAYAMSTTRASSISDAKNLKVWAPKGDRTAIRLLNAFDITPIPLSPVDVLTGLQTGLIDTITAPPVSVLALQWHTQVRYMLDLPFMYIYSVFLVDSKRFNRLNEQDQVIVQEVFGDAVEKVEAQNIKDHTSTVAVLAKRGIEVVSPTNDEIDEWQSAARAEVDRWLDQGLITPDTVHKIEGVLAPDREN